MCGVQTCKRRSSHSTQDYHSIKFRLFLVTLGCGGSVTANYWLDLFCHQFLFSLIAYIQEKKSAHCVNFFPKLFRIALQRVRKSWLNLPSSLPVLQIDLAISWNVIFMIRTKCQNMLRWSGQNANQKVGTDKMPTTEISPDKMPTYGWHYVRLAFCPTTFLN